MYWRRAEPPPASETATNAANIRRVLGFLAPYKVQVGIVLATVAVSSGIGVIPPLLVRAIIDDAITGQDLSLLTWLVLASFGFAMLSGLVGVLQSYLNNVVSQKVISDLRERMYSHLQRMSLRFFTESRSGELVSRVTNDVSGIEGVLSGTLCP